MTTEYINLKAQEQEELPAIYVADLADYNAGILRGRWIEIDEYTDVDDLKQEISEMLAEKGHEEYAVHDYNNLPSSDLGEWPNLKQVIEVAQAVHEHGYELVKGYLSFTGLDELSELNDRFLGIYDSLEDYAYDYINECYDLEKALGNLAGYFDYEAFARDLDLNGDINAVQLSLGRVAIFRSY